MEQFPHIETLLPHRDSMKLIEEIIELKEDRAVVGATVSPQWPLVDNGGVSSLVLVELVAQAAAIVLGWQRLKAHKNAGRVGWIVGVRQARFDQDSLPFGTFTTIAAHTELTIENYTKIKGTAAVGRRQIASVSLQVFGREKV